MDFIAANLLMLVVAAVLGVLGWGLWNWLLPRDYADRGTLLRQVGMFPFASLVWISTVYCILDAFSQLPRMKLGEDFEVHLARSGCEIYSLREREWLLVDVVGIQVTGKHLFVELDSHQYGVIDRTTSRVESPLSREKLADVARRAGLELNLEVCSAAVAKAVSLPPVLVFVGIFGVPLLFCLILLGKLVRGCFT